MELRFRLLILSVFLPLVVFGKVFQTLPKVLKSSFVKEVKEKQLILTSEKEKNISKTLGSDWDKSVSRIFTYFQSDTKKSRIFIDQHDVRTLPETIIIEIGNDQSINNIEVLSFFEPQEYLAPKGWLNMFKGKKFDPSKPLKTQKIDGITGATLTSHAIMKAVRKISAVNQVLENKQ